MLALLQMPANVEQILHERGTGGASFGKRDMLTAARWLGLRARMRRATTADLESLPVPAIATARDGSHFLIAQVGTPPAMADRTPGRRFLVQTYTNGGAGNGVPPGQHVWDEDQLTAHWSGELLLMSTQAALAGTQRRFDLAWFLPFLVKYRRPLLQVLAASFVIQVVSLVTPVFFQLVIDKVLVHGTLATLEVLAVGLVVVLVWEVALGGLRQWLLAHTTSRIDAELGAQLFRHLLRLPLVYFETRRVGDTVARVRELESIREFLTGPGLTVLLDLLFTLVFFGVMLLYSPFLTLVVALSLPAYALITALIVPGLRRRLDEKFDRGADAQSFLVESVSSVRTLKAMAVEPRMRRDWELKLAAYLQSGFKVARLALWGQSFVQLTSKLTTVAILYFGAKLVIDGELTVGALVAFNMLAGRVAAPVLRLAQLAQDVQQVRISVERLGDVLNTTPEPDAPPHRLGLPAIEGHVRLERVRFRYGADAPEVLQGVDLDIPAGQVLGVVGRSGSGKSTLAALLQRLHVPQQGRVLIDGADLALVDPAWLRRQVGVVLQESELFNRSVRDNIALADPTAAMEDVIAAAQLAGAHEFILELPHGYDTPLEERGRNLSGGQRQRVAIARALLTKPRILILDEATSALDAESESIIQANLARIAQGRTVIIIAHRLSAVRDAQQIVTLERGLIIERGTHASLLAAGGRYADLYRRQMGMPLDAAATRAGMTGAAGPASQTGPVGVSP